MKLKLFTVIAVLAGLAPASGTPEKGEERKGHSHSGIKELIEKFDKDGDGKLNAEERKAASEARKAGFIKRFDKDGDGKLSAEERKAVAEAVAEAMRDRRGRRPEGRRPRPEGRPEGRRTRSEGDKPEGRKPHSRKPEGRKPRTDDKPRKKPGKKK